MHLVYYLAHCETHVRLQYHKTRAGARIAQRSRNARLGFHTRIERVLVGNLEYERCLLNQQVVDATWVIEEGTVDSPDLLV